MEPTGLFAGARRPNHSVRCAPRGFESPEATARVFGGDGLCGHGATLAHGPRKQKKSETDAEEWGYSYKILEARLAQLNAGVAGVAQSGCAGEGPTALFTLTCRAMFPFFQGSRISARRKETVACRMASCNEEHGESDRSRRSKTRGPKSSFLSPHFHRHSSIWQYVSKWAIDNRPACGSSIVTNVI